MNGHTRLVKRNSIYYVRARIPAFLVYLIKSTQFNYSLKTHNYYEALAKLQETDLVSQSPHFRGLFNRHITSFCFYTKKLYSSTKKMPFLTLKKRIFFVFSYSQCSITQNLPNPITVLLPQ